MKWQGLPADEATWEPLQHFKDLYPDVQLEDELFEEVG
jgi:transcriptional regulator GlxA family with amidase domain